MAISHRAGRVVDFCGATMIWLCVLGLPALWFVPRPRALAAAAVIIPLAAIGGFVAERRHNRRGGQA